MDNGSPHSGVMGLFACGKEMQRDIRDICSVYLTEAKP
jgi:hypothetical protein